jgi:hypothetical protein
MLSYLLRFLISSSFNINILSHMLLRLPPLPSLLLLQVMRKRTNVPGLKRGRGRGRGRGFYGPPRGRGGYHGGYGYGGGYGYEYGGYG